MAGPGLWLLGLGAACVAGYAAVTSKQLPEGQRPFDDFPPGVDRSKTVAVEQVKASSGNRYKVTSFRHSDGRLYYVAEKVGDVDWISYFFTPGTGVRQRWHANADNTSDLAGMAADFDLAAQVAA